MKMFDGEELLRMFPYEDIKDLLEAEPFRLNEELFKKSIELLAEKSRQILVRVDMNINKDGFQAREVKELSILEHQYQNDEYHLVDLNDMDWKLEQSIWNDLPIDATEEDYEVYLERITLSEVILIEIY